MWGKLLMAPPDPFLEFVYIVTQKMGYAPYYTFVYISVSMTHSSWLCVTSILYLCVLTCFIIQQTIGAIKTNKWMKSPTDAAQRYCDLVLFLFLRRPGESHQVLGCVGGVNVVWALWRDGCGCYRWWWRWVTGHLRCTDLHRLRDWPPHPSSHGMPLVRLVYLDSCQHFFFHC